MEALDDRLGDLLLGQAVELDLVMGAHERHAVGVRPKRGVCAGDVVCDDEVAALARELLAGVLEHVVRLGGKADDDAVSPALGERGENVGVLGERDLVEGFGGLLELVVGCLLGAVVGDRGRQDRRVCRGEGVLRGLEHLGCRGDVDHAHAGWLGKRDGAGDERHVRAVRGGSRGDGISHLARGGVGEVAHGVHRFMRGAGRDDHALAGEVPAGAQAIERGRDDLVHRGQLADARLAAGEPSGLGAHDEVVAALERLDVRDRGEVLPHVHVHGRHHDDGAGARKQGGAHGVVGDAVSHLGDDVGRGRAHEGEVGPLGKLDVWDGRALVAEQVERHVMA